MSENSPSCIRFGVSHRCPDAIYTGFSGGVINGTQNRYDEHFGFDKMGNTTSFTRNGLLSSSGGYGTIDNLSFTYNGNQKIKITDAGTNGIFYGNEEFVRNTTNSGNSCAYDANGNRLYDSNSNIWGIRYNTLNLPDAMQFYQGHQTNYTYSASGTKLKVIDKTAPEGVFLPVTSLNTILSNPSVSTITITDYVGNIIYENGTLKRILTPVGYWQDGTYYYFLKDHLGSNRVVMTGSGGIAETSSYYPSGMRFGESAVNGGNVQPYRHTGHEMQEMHGLNWIDNLARFRTVSDGSGFTGVDPLAEKYYSISPYAYCAGNPVLLVDPNGMWTETATSYNTSDPDDIAEFFNNKKQNSNKDNAEQKQKQETVDYLKTLEDSYSGLYNQIQKWGANVFDIFTKKKEATQPNGEKAISYKARNLAPDYMSVNVSGSAYIPLIPAFGGGFDLSLGYVKNDGLFLLGGTRTGIGFDFSISGGLSLGGYTGNFKPSAMSLTGLGAYQNVGVGIFSLGSSQNVTLRNGIPSVGSQWIINNISVGIGLSPINGSIGISNTFQPYYFTKK